MPSLDYKLGLSVGSYVGLLVAFGTALVLDTGLSEPTVQAAGILTCLFVGSVFARRPALATPVLRYHVLSVSLTAHIGGILVLLALNSRDGATAVESLLFPLIFSAGAGLFAFIFVRDRHVEATFGGRTARVSWYGGPHPRTIRRLRIVAVLAAVTVISAPFVSFLVVPHWAGWLESTRLWALLGDIAPTIIGSVLGASVGLFLSPDREKRFTVYDDGVVVQNGASGFRIPLAWWYVRGYELTDRELVVHTWFPLQAFRFDRVHFEQPDRVVDILAEYVPERGTTRL
ncbi:hypothetical protein [Haloarchaeobius baliensis]|uniref:hypothetical protein n=1 Tax=Haloarchaeobius baliensis TaxID=1670458 RepID=UPI003F88564F